MLSGEAANINFIVFGLARPGLEPTNYHTRCEHANHYTHNAVNVNTCTCIRFYSILDFRELAGTTLLKKYPNQDLRNKSLKPECVFSFSMDWRILVFYPEPEERDKIY